MTETFAARTDAGESITASRRMASRRRTTCLSPPRADFSKRDRLEIRQVLEHLGIGTELVVALGPVNEARVGVGLPVGVFVAGPIAGDEFLGADEHVVLRIADAGHP